MGNILKNTLKKRKSSVWASGAIRESYEKVVKEEAGRLGIVREILRKSTDFLWRIIAPVGGSGGGTLSYIWPHCNSFPPKDFIWWVSTTKKHCSWWCSGERYEWRAPNRVLVVQLGTSEDGAKVFRGHVVAQGFCVNLINALKLLANQQKDGDSPIQNIIMGLKEKCRERNTNGLRSFMTSDNYSAVEVGHQRRGQRPFKVVRPKMNGDSSEVPREGADDLRLRECIIVDHTDQNLWRAALGGRRLVRILPGNLQKELKGVSGKICTIITEK